MFWLVRTTSARGGGIGLRGRLKNNFEVALPKILESEVANLPLDVILDGEAVGDTFYAFDALLIGKDIQAPISQVIPMCPFS